MLYPRWHQQMINFIFANYFVYFSQNKIFQCEDYVLNKTYYFNISF